MPVLFKLGLLNKASNDLCVFSVCLVWYITIILDHIQVKKVLILRMLLPVSWVKVPRLQPRSMPVPYLKIGSSFTLIQKNK